MKQKLLILLLFTFSLSVFAQSEDQKKSKEKTKDEYITPRTGDWGIGIDASPFFQYVGNLFSQNGNPYVPGFAFTSQHPGSIYVKYKLNKGITLRSIVTIGVSNVTNEINNPDSVDYPNTQKTSAYDLGIIFGFERNKSIKGRIVAYYGAQAGIRRKPFSNGTLTGDIDFNNPTNSNLNYYEKGGNSINYSLEGFAGIEYFFLPRIAFAGELGLGFGGYSTNDRVYKLGDGDEQISEKGGKGFSIAPVASGNLSIFIYF